MTLDLFDVNICTAIKRFVRFTAKFTRLQKYENNAFVMVDYLSNVVFAVIKAVS